MVTDASLPQIEVSRNITVEFGDEVSLACNFTRPGNFFITLVTIAWIKDSENIMEVPRPKEGELKDINLKIDQPEDGGHYRCKLVTLLHQHRTYNITKLIIVKGMKKPHGLDGLTSVYKWKLASTLVWQAAAVNNDKFKGENKSIIP